MVIKERRTKILISLFLFSDTNIAGFSPVSFNQSLQKVFDLSLNQKTRGTLSALIKEELIQKIPANTADVKPVAGQTADSLDNRYCLTPKGFAVLSLEFPFFRYLINKWDGRWRVLSYEIPEKKRELRDRLRREVAGWGLGPWHRSFWLTPHPIIDNLKQLVSQKEEEKYIQAFEAQHVFGDREILIEKVWGKTDLDKKYRELFKHWHEILSKDDEKTSKLTRVVNEYVVVLRLDPGLPKELIGESWIGFEAFNIYKEIRSILLA